MLKDIQSVSLLDILPGNLLEDAQVYAAAKSLDDELQRVTMVCCEVLHLPRLDELPEAVLDLLAWQWHVDFYEPLGLDIATKRRLIKESIAWHRRKGTPSAVEEVATAVFGRAKVSEWFDYSGEPYHFRIDLLEAPGLPDKINKIARLVETIKNTRSVLDGIHFNQQLADAEYYGAAPQIHRRYAAAQVFKHAANTTTYAGAAMGSHKAFLVKQVTPVNDTATSATYYTGIAPVVHKRYRV